jgi:hypothetical protein
MYSKSNRYGLDDNDLDDDDDGEEFEYDGESDHDSSFEGHTTYRTPIRIERESPLHRFDSPLYIYRPPSPLERAMSRSPSLIQDAPHVECQRDSPESDMEDMRISPESMHLPSSPKPHSSSSSAHGLALSLPPFDSNPPYFSPSPPVVHTHSAFPSEAEDHHRLFTVPSLLCEPHSQRNIFASEHDLDSNIDSGSCHEVVAPPTELRAEIFQRMEKLKVLQVC